MKLSVAAYRFPGQWKNPPFLIAILVSVMILVIDIIIPRGINEGYLYVIPVLITLWAPGRGSTLFITFLSLIFTVIGFLESPPGIPIHLSVINRSLSLLGVIIMMVMILRNKNKEEKLRQQTLQLEKYIAKLKISNAELEQFAYVASHDLQEPLRNIRNFITLLEEKINGRSDEETHEFLGVVATSADKMQLLVKNLLLYSLLGKERPRQPVDCEKVVAGIRTEMFLTLQETGARIVVGKLPEVHFNETELAQLFRNLLENSVKFRAADRPPEIVISCTDLPDEWQFSVSDNGIGMEPEYIGKIFNLFQRLHSENEYPGLGIGLPMCKKIVELNDGKIWVTSVPGQGSVFSFTIPKYNVEKHEKAFLHSAD
jgi:signal transduction histidine kinase